MNFEVIPKDEGFLLKTKNPFSVFPVLLLYSSLSDFQPVTPLQHSIFLVHLFDILLLIRSLLYKIL